MLLYRSPDTLGEVFLGAFLLQFLFELRRKERQKLGIAGNERSRGVGRAKYDRILWRSADHRTAEVALDGLHVRARLNELDAPRRNARAGAMASYREHPGEAAFDQHWRLDLVSEEPAELDAPLVAIRVLQDLFRAGELFVATHLLYGRAEILRREGGKPYGVEAFGPVFRSQQETNRGVGADFAHRTPQSKEFLSREEHSRFIDQSLGESRSAQDRRGTDSQFFQLVKRAARDAKVFIHRLTQI